MGVLKAAARAAEHPDRDEQDFTSSVERPKRRPEGGGDAGADLDGGSFTAGSAIPLASDPEQHTNFPMTVLSEM